MKHIYSVSGMSCQNCANKIKKVLMNVPHITNVEIDLNEGVAKVEMSQHVILGELNGALRELDGKYVLSEDISASKKAGETISPLTTYMPLIVVITMIVIVTIILCIVLSISDIIGIMSAFMGVWFMIFGAIKLIDVKGFALAYSSYDIIAQKFMNYGYAYPFIEFGLGCAYIRSLFDGRVVAWSWSLYNVTFIIMVISTIGVMQALRRKTIIQCACLGSAFKLPMSTVTLVEDLLMVLMSGLMILMLLF